jgi:DNA-binding NarL/FixJ family response regulator
MNRPTVLLVDGHVRTRDEVRQLLKRAGLSIVGEASDGRQAVRLTGSLHPALVLLDISLPVLNGLDAAKQILRAFPQTRVILFSGRSDDSYVVQALSAGAGGYLLKEQAGACLLDAIAEVCRGNVYLSPPLARPLLDVFRAPQGIEHDPLTARERQVIQLIAEGKSTKELADLLSISVSTAKAHRDRIMKKLDIHHTAGLVRYAIRNRIISA